MPRSGKNRKSGASVRGRKSPADPRSPTRQAGQALRFSRNNSPKISSAEWQSYLQTSRRKGEWLELRLPEALAADPPTAIFHRYDWPLSHKQIGKLIGDQGVVKQGRLFKLRLFPAEPLGMPADWMELNILYEDEFVLAVNKPIHIEVHPSSHGQRGTLANGVAAYYEATGQRCRVRPVHRIDKDTTGPVLFAKNESGQAYLNLAMKQGRIERRYLALAEGQIKEERGSIDRPIGQDRHHSTRRRISDTGDKAVTR